MFVILLLLLLFYTCTFTFVYVCARPRVKLLEYKIQLHHWPSTVKGVNYKYWRGLIIISSTLSLSITIFLRVSAYVLFVIPCILLFVIPIEFTCTTCMTVNSSHVWFSSVFQFNNYLLYVTVFNFFLLIPNLFFICKRFCF